MWIKRLLEKSLIEGDLNLLLLGPRQVGKSSLLSHSFDIPFEYWLETIPEEKPYLVYNLLRDEEYLRLSRSPNLLRQEVLAAAGRHPHLIVIIDEVQRVPALFNEVQSIIDFHKTSKIRFFLSGSSARKLKRGGANLLPGRLVIKKLPPLRFAEWEPTFSLDNILRIGSLPGILTAEPGQQWELIKNYVNIYLKEEIQAEGLSRGIGPFSRFLEVAASASGQQINYNSLSRDAGIPYSTIRHYFQILEDTLVGTLLYPYTGKTAKRLSLHPKLYLFDLGVRNALINLNVETIPATEYGRLFEYFIILEIIRMVQSFIRETPIYFWRTQAGAEVDCVIQADQQLIAIEIKAKKDIHSRDLTGLIAFNQTYPGKVKKMMVLSLNERPAVIDGIDILPWQKGLELLKSEELISTI